MVRHGAVMVAVDLSVSWWVVRERELRERAAERPSGGAVGKPWPGNAANVCTMAEKLGGNPAEAELPLPPRVSAREPLTFHQLTRHPETLQPLGRAERGAAAE